MRWKKGVAAGKERVTYGLSQPSKCEKRRGELTQVAKKIEGHKNAYRAALRHGNSYLTRGKTMSGGKKRAMIPMGNLKRKETGQ